MEIRFHLWMSGWSPAGSGDVFGGGGSVPVACTRQSHMVATEKPTWEPPSVFRTSFISLLKARAKSFKSNYLKHELPQVLIRVFKQKAGLCRDWALTDVGRGWQGLVQCPWHPLPINTTLFKLLLGQIMSLQLPPTPVTASLLSDPTAQPESSRWSLHPLRPSRAQTHSSRHQVTAKATGHLHPKLPKEGKLPQEEVPSIPHSSESFWMSGHPTLLPYYCFLPYSVLDVKNLDFSLWQGWFSCQGQPSWEIWFLCSQGLVKHTTANGWKVKSASSRRGGGQHIPEQGKDGRALLHHLSRNPAEMLQSLKIIAAKTVPFFSLASSFPPFFLETHYPHRGSSTQQMKHFSKAHCEGLQCRQTIASLTAHSPKKPKEHLVHCIFFLSFVIL